MFRTKTILAQAECRTYRDYDKFLAGEKEKVIARNVVVRKHYKKIIVRLYGTDILIFYPNGTFSADNGNGEFATITTIDRLNQFGPSGVNFFHASGVLFANENDECGHDKPLAVPTSKRGRKRQLAAV